MTLQMNGKNGQSIDGNTEPKTSRKKAINRKADRRSRETRIGRDVELGSPERGVTHVAG